MNNDNVESGGSPGSPEGEPVGPPDGEGRIEEEPRQRQLIIIPTEVRGGIVSFFRNYFGAKGKGARENLERDLGNLWSGEYQKRKEYEYVDAVDRQRMAKGLPPLNPRLQHGLQRGERGRPDRMYDEYNAIWQRYRKVLESEDTIDQIQSDLRRGDITQTEADKRYWDLFVDVGDPDRDQRGNPQADRTSLMYFLNGRIQHREDRIQQAEERINRDIPQELDQRRRAARGERTRIQKAESEADQAIRKEERGIAGFQDDHDRYVVLREILSQLSLGNIDQAQANTAWREFRRYQDRYSQREQYRRTEEREGRGPGRRAILWLRDQLGTKRFGYWRDITKPFPG